jgi:predicted phosphodiesterase
MRIALLSDIHGNFEALTAVLKDMEQYRPDEVWCLGDVVGYGCDPIPCLDLINRTCSVKLVGNHEHAVLGLDPIETYNDAARESAEWTRNTLTGREQEMIRSFAVTHEAEGILAVHASPFEPEEWYYVLSAAEAEDAFAAFDGNVCFHGHTHIPVIFTHVPGGKPRRKAAHDFDPLEENRYLVNVGSVGQPRDNDPRACWVFYDAEEKRVEFNRVEYDISRTQTKMTEAELPEMLVSRLAVGR